MIPNVLLASLAYRMARPFDFPLRWLFTARRVRTLPRLLHMVKRDAQFAAASHLRLPPRYCLVTVQR